jgi:hypothetical protein
MTLNAAGLMTLHGLGFVLPGALAQTVGSADAIALAGCCGIAATVILMGRELKPAEAQNLRPRRRSSSLAPRSGG